jgi:hypothetical protein
MESPQGARESGEATSLRELQLASVRTAVSPGTSKQARDLFIQRCTNNSDFEPRNGRDGGIQFEVVQQMVGEGLPGRQARCHRTTNNKSQEAA